MKTIITSSLEETQMLGEKIAALLKKGDIICLCGDLGAGKTALSKGMGTGLGISDYITSPTYTIINEYKGRLSLYHFDVYRINDVDEMYELGYEEYFNGDGVCIIEWADIISSIIPESAIWINLSYGINEDERKFIIDNKEWEAKL